ncbi:hypothetical protein ANN_14721 [Periplaneta americana]|uniref:Uncharacterized protein n=1 Tax=Periplaneta americana TaxID=6978 RepID=A0ABQ8SYJ2_PERAM|nr:hypothetical protein ANN_14721 [Periplaneta americana]
MAGLCESGNEPPGSLKAICKIKFDGVRTVKNSSDDMPFVPLPTFLDAMIKNSVLRLEHTIKYESKQTKMKTGHRF